MKPIPDFPNYFADENGGVFSMKPMRRSAKPPTEPRLLKLRKDGGGYDINEKGEVFSFWEGAGRKWILLNTPRKLKPTKNRDGYPQVVLYRDGERFTRTIHRLVLETFVGPRPEGMQGCHNDGIKINNRLGNLRYDTPQNNGADKKLHGTMVCGEKHGRAKLIADKVLEIRRLSVLGEIQRTIANKFGITQATVSDIVRGKIWKYLSS
jgi:hypothetical protein